MFIENSQVEILIINGSVVQWIVFQIPILKMQVRFLPGLQQNNQKKSKPLNLKGWAVFVFVTYPKYSSKVNSLVSDSVSENIFKIHEMRTGRSGRIVFRAIRT